MAAITEVLPRPSSATSGLWSWVTTVDHKRIGVLYGTTALIFMLLSGIEAGLIRMQLATPDTDILGPSRYNQMFTSARHGYDLHGHHADGCRVL